ncbi:MAG: DUF393 domain-containing protein [Acidimicrobiales bacterium]|nr:MAG: DUF393 domain-containing protein [Acidimicrobiales bacterium]
MSTRPVFLYDGDCAFCSACASFINRRIHPGSTLLPRQAAPMELLGVTEQQCNAAVQWIAHDSQVFSGPRAIAELLISAGSIWRPLGWALRIPPLSWLAEPLYRLISRNRSLLPGGTAACSLPPAERSKPG